MTVTVVAALGRNRAIGFENDLLWRLPGDLASFKALTMGHVLVMGRATYESIGRPLPGRTTVVVTRSKDFHPEDVFIADSVPGAIELASSLDDEVFVVGGGLVYSEALGRDLVDRMVLSHVDDSPTEADTFFPETPWENWVELDRRHEPGPPPYDVVTWQRRVNQQGQASR